MTTNAPTWRRWMFDNFLVHVVPLELESRLLADLAARGAQLSAERRLPDGPITNPAPLTGWSIDLGGAMAQHRPVEEFEWAGLKMSVPSEHVAGAIRLLRQCRRRRFADDTPYFKLKYWHFALVMTPRMGLELRNRLTDIAEPALARAQAFDAAMERGARMGVS